jgi:hypothetical protein
MHGTSLQNLLTRARARTSDVVILAALEVCEHLFHMIASYKINVGCKQCRAAYAKDKARASEFKHRQKRTKQSKA